MSGRELPVCPKHGLRYDPEIHAGCLRCRSVAPPPAASASRGWLVAAAAGAGAIVVLAVLAFIGWRVVARRRAEAADQARTEARARTRREVPASPVTLAAVPTELPLVGPVGKDPYGEPTQHIDRPALRAAVFHGEYADATRWFEQLQSDFEADPTREYWIQDAADAFYSAEPELRAALDAWVAATPQSFAPWLARAAHGRASAWAKRGSAYKKDTPDSDFAAMRQVADAALRDVEHARELRPKLVASARAEIGLRMLGGAREEVDRAYQRAISACPTCWAPRAAYMNALTPRWGGSYEAMAAFARGTLDARAPRTKLLPGFLDLDRSQLLRHDRKYDDAKLAIDRACALGELWNFLEERAEVAQGRGDWAAALPDLDRALELRPGEPNLLYSRSLVHYRLRRLEEAAIDLLAGVRAEPTHSDAAWLLAHVVPDLATQAGEVERSGRHADALRLYDLASDLAPNDGEIVKSKVSASMGQTPADPPEVVAAYDAVRASPDDFATQRKLDDALAARNEYARIVPIWDAYLARHPDDARGWFERAGTYAHLRRAHEALDDAHKACSLGLADACTWETRMRQRAAGR